MSAFCISSSWLFWRKGIFRIVLLYLQKSYHYIALLKAVMRLSVTNMKAADVKDVASSVTAIANEKLKAEKEAAAGRKKTGMCTGNRFLNSLLILGLQLRMLVSVDKLL